MKYTIPYEVDAETPFAAIVKATELLRTGVKVEHVKRVEASVPGWYYVDLEVSEPDTPEAREDHDATHPDTIEGCGPCENRAERSAAYWERAMRTY